MTRDDGPGPGTQGRIGDRPVVVIGVGNVLLGDDGVGVRVVEALGRSAEHDPGALPPGTRLLDGGTLGLDLLPDVEDAGALVLVDAVDLGHAPGTVTVVRGERLTTAGGFRALSRQGGVGELLATARLLAILPPEVVLVGVQAGSISVGPGLSRGVVAALPAAVEAVRRTAHGMARRIGVVITAGGAGRSGVMRIGFDRGLRALIVANFLVVAALASIMVAGWLQILPDFDAQPSPSASAAPSADLMQMGLAHIPTSSDCLLCHDKGGEGGLKPIPALGHPLDGWQACLVCHTNEDLGRVAPGHEGIAQSECLNCHKVAPLGPAITQAHSELERALSRLPRQRRAPAVEHGRAQPGRLLAVSQAGRGEATPGTAPQQPEPDLPVVSPGVERRGPPDRPRAALRRYLRPVPRHGPRRSDAEAARPERDAVRRRDLGTRAGIPLFNWRFRI